MVDVSAHYFWHATPSWRKWTALEEDKLSRPHHIITRFALNTPFRPNQPGYVSYHDRCQMLGVINFQLRQVRLSAQFLYKVMTEATHTTIRHLILSNLYTQNQHQRHQTHWLTINANRKYQGTIINYLIRNFERLGFTRDHFQLSYFAFKQILSTSSI